MMSDDAKKTIDADIEKVEYENSEDIFGRITFLETEICEAMFEFKTKFMWYERVYREEIL